MDWLNEQKGFQKISGYNHFATLSLQTGHHPLKSLIPNLKFIAPEIYDRTLLSETVPYHVGQFSNSIEQNYNSKKSNLCMFFGSLAGGEPRITVKKIMDIRNSTHGDCPFTLLTDRYAIEGLYNATISAKFGFNFRGDTFSARRVISHMFVGVIPVLICDKCAYPFENLIDYDKFAVFIPEKRLNDPDFDLIKHLEGYSDKKLKEMSEIMKNNLHRLKYYQNVTVQGDAIDSIVYELFLFNSLFRNVQRVAPFFLNS